MKKIIRKIKHWYRWIFVYTEKEKTYHDFIFMGTSIMKDGKRINHNKFYKKPPHKINNINLK